MHSTNVKKKKYFSSRL